MKIHTASRQSGMTIRSSLKEAGKPLSGGSRFRVRLIQEGIGNLEDCFYYSKQALSGSKEIFEGKKCFANHPDKMEEQVRPERNIRDILGHFEKVAYEESDGRGMLTADLVLKPGLDVDWAKELLTTSIDYAKKFPDSDFVGLSINASGDADEVSLEDFLKNTDIPMGVLPKLQKAQSMGISMVRVVNALTEAQSVDVVTEAGAGGKILRMLESEREKKMKKEAEKKENEKKEAEKKESAEAHKEDANGVEGGNPEDHADAQQDMELFKQMVSEFLPDHGEDPEAEALGKHAYECYKEDGMADQEAYQSAGKHLQMSKKIGMKQKGAMESESEAKESEAKESEAEAEEAQTPPPNPKSTDGAAKDNEVDGAGKVKMKKVTETHYESEAKKLRTDLVKANGEIAKLRESLKKYELNEHLDKKCKEAAETHKLSNQVTRKFRESLGTPKSKEQIDSELKTFIGAYQFGMECSSESDSFLMVEKGAGHKSTPVAEGDMTDCLTD